MSSRHDLANLVETLNSEAGNSPHVIAGLPILLDAHRAEVLREAKAKAEEITDRLFGAGTTDMDLQRAGGARAVAWELAQMADEAATA
ncbi:hypothetical protein ACWCPT_29680 [Streptomyces sp. NPDC002308]